MARDSVQVEEWVDINGSCSPGGFLSYPAPYPYPYLAALPHRPQGPPSRSTATLLSGAAAPARTKRISPGLARGLAAALGRSTRSFTLCLLPFLQSQLLPLPPSTLSFSTHVSFSFYFALQLTEPDETSLPKFLEDLTYSMLCTRREICLNP